MTRPPPRKTPGLEERAPESLDPREPRRLMQDREVGGLLERANVAYRARLDEPAAFQRLEARLEPRSATWGWRSLTAAAALSLAAGVALFVGVLDEEPTSRVAFGPELSSSRSRTTLSPEPVGRAEPAAPGGAQDTRLAQGQAGDDSLAEELHGDGRSDDQHAGDDGTLASETDSERRSETDGDRRSGPEDDAVEPEVTERPARDLRDRAREKVPAEGPERTVTAEVPERTVTAPTPRAPRTDGTVSPVNRLPGIGAPTSMTPPADGRPDCVDLVGQGEPRAAELCYAQRAAGSGLSAEAALYEMARLRRDALHDPNGALATLDDYRQRFPNGSLHNEVALSRLELLAQLGRGREALRESEALLASAKGKERAAELHMLRGNVYRADVGDFRAAAREYEKAEALGGALGAEATRLRGASLEAAGDGAGALKAYQRYLGLPGVEKRTEVARRVEAMLAKERGAVAP